MSISFVYAQILVQDSPAFDKQKRKYIQNATNTLICHLLTLDAAAQFQLKYRFTRLGLVKCSLSFRKINSTPTIPIEIILNATN